MPLLLGRLIARTSAGLIVSVFVFFKQKTADVMRISDGGSDVGSSDLEPSLAMLDRLEKGRWELTERGQQKPLQTIDRKSVVLGKSVSVRVALGGRRLLNKQNHKTHRQPSFTHRPAECSAHL